MSRSRQPRANHGQDADEEKRLWNQIRSEARRIDTLIVGAGKPSDAASDDKLESLYRENVRLSEQIQHAIEGKSDDMNLLDHIRILAALRESAEDSIHPSSSHRSASTNGTGHSIGGAKSRSALFAKRKAASALSAGTSTTSDPGSTSNANLAAPDEHANDDTSPAAPSPRTANGRLTAGPPAGRDKSTRASSAAPSLREASVKVEDAESVASSADDTRGPPSATSTSTSATPLVGSSSSQQAGIGGIGTQRPQLVPDAMVFYRNKGRAQEGEGILCRVSNVIGDGKQRRYEIQDADPEPGAGEPTPYRASVSHLIPIPTTNVGLPDLPKGKNVLAQYPDTTTFYKAEVSTPWRAKDMVGDKGRHVRLRFEGEMEEAKETEVERRFVVPDVK